MSEGLLDGARIFRLPSNAELGLTEKEYIYSTKPFPSWRLCLNTSGHPGKNSVLFNSKSCPQCGSTDSRRVERIGFFRACTDGHLDDVFWSSLVHQSGECTNSNWFIWTGGGGTLTQVNIRCPICRRTANLGEAYGRPWKCSGRRPEREGPGAAVRNSCSSSAKIIQRQASNLRLPELRSLFTIPPRATRLQISCKCDLLERDRFYRHREYFRKR